MTIAPLFKISLNYALSFTLFSSMHFFFHISCSSIPGSSFSSSYHSQASKRGLTYPRYAWITDGDYIDGWWRGSVSGAIDSCSDESVTNLLDRALAVQLCPVAAPNSTRAVESWHGPQGYIALPGPINGPHWDAWCA